MYLYMCFFVYLGLAMTGTHPSSVYMGYHVMEVKFTFQMHRIFLYFI